MIEYWPNLDTAGFLKTNQTVTGTWSVLVKAEPGNNEFKVSLTSNYPLGEKSFLETTDKMPMLSLIVAGTLVPIGCTLITAYIAIKTRSPSKA